MISNRKHPHNRTRHTGFTPHIPYNRCYIGIYSNLDLINTHHDTHSYLKHSIFYQKTCPDLSINRVVPFIESFVYKRLVSMQGAFLLLTFCPSPLAVKV